MNLPHSKKPIETRGAFGRTNSFLAVGAALSLVTLITVAESPTDGSWSDAVKALGIVVDSDDYRNIVRRYGELTRSQSERREIVKFKSAGLALEAEQGRVVEVVLQIAPGKSIKKTSFDGELPKGVIAARSSPEDAIRILGLPLSDTEGGYRKLRYSVGDFFMTLYYGPQLHFVAFTKK